MLQKLLFHICKACGSASHFRQLSATHSAPQDENKCDAGVDFSPIYYTACQDLLELALCVSVSDVIHRV